MDIFLSGNHEKDLGDVVFTDEATMLSVLDDPHYEVVVNHSSNVQDDEIPLSEPCTVIWDNSNGREWFIGMIRERISKDEYLIDYLESDPKDTNKKLLRYPSKDDGQPTKTIQVISCNVIGAWDLTTRKTTFTLHNHEIIERLFQSLIQEITSVTLGTISKYVDNRKFLVRIILSFFG